MTCPHQLNVALPDEPAYYLCTLDDGPCDVTRKGFCDRWGKEGDLIDGPVYRYKIIARDKCGKWHEIGRYATKRMAQRMLPGSCGAKYTEAKIEPI